MSPAKIDAKAAIIAAKASARDLLGWRNTIVEEIERETYKRRDVWSITLSQSDQAGKDYKRFLVDSTTGDLEGVRIRQLLAS